jgi:hypothetical protein
MAIDDLEISFIAPSLCPHTSLILSIVPTCTVLSLLRSSSLDHVRIPRQLETEAWKWSGQIVAGSSHILRSSQSEASLIDAIRCCRHGLRSLPVHCNSAATKVPVWGICVCMLRAASPFTDSGQLFRSEHTLQGFERLCR